MATLALWTAIIAAALAVIGVVVVRSWDDTAEQASPGIVVGTPRGVAVVNSSPSPRPTSSPGPTPEATPPPTPAPSRIPATPDPATPEPTPVVVTAAGPADAVAAFYASVAAGNFDAAYDLWSQRMHTTYPRSENLDNRFAETASVSFDELYVAEQSADRATVQANFVETYDSGVSRSFVGYWRLALVDGRWLLDEPHY
jgi:hypothetical protein